MNDLFKRYGNASRANVSLPEPLKNAAYAMQMLNQFSAGLNGGNPEMIAKMLMRTGRMSKAQYQQLDAMVSQLQNVLTKK